MCRHGFLDTTVLANGLLKRKHDEGKAALAAIKEYRRTSTLAYALKELQLGPLRGYIWLHNALLTTGSLKDTYGRLQALSRSLNRNLTSTALEALRESAAEVSAPLRGASVAEQDREQAEALRLACKGLIFRAWLKRRRLAKISFPLPCYAEGAPVEDHRRAIINGEACPASANCGLSAHLRERAEDIEKLRRAILATKSTRREDQSRTKALKEFLKKPDQPLASEHCRRLGDAVFVLLCPEDAEILTTNLRDFKPLAAALQKVVRKPGDSAGAAKEK